MKKTILIAATLAMVINLSAQITINRSHLIVSGQILTQATDDNGITILSGGANKTWNLSTLQASSKDTLKFGDPGWFIGHSNFPNANLGLVYSSNDSACTYLSIDNNGLKVVGDYSISNGIENITNISTTIISFPSTFNTTFAGSTTTPLQQIYIGKDLDSTGPYPFIDSIRLKLNQNSTSIIDGWGSLTTPLGTYNVLKQTATDINTIKVDMKTSGFWIGVPANLLNSLGMGNFTADTSYSHQFWTNDASVGFPLVTYSFSPRDTTTSSVDWLQTKPKISKVTSTVAAATLYAYPNPCHTTFTVSIPVSTTAYLSIFDLNGKLVNTQKVSNGASVDVSSLENGIYTLRFNDSTTGANIQNQKIIKY